MTALSSERHSFELSISAASLRVDQLKGNLEIMNERTKVDLGKISFFMDNIDQKSTTFQEFMKRSIELTGALNQKVKIQEENIKTIKIQMGELTIFKTKK